MPNIQANKLKKLCLAILHAAGTPEEESEIVADQIIKANLRGVDSHGVRNIPRYIRNIKEGTITPGSPILTIKDTPTTAMWDVNNNFGFVAAKRAMETAIQKAKIHRLGAVGTLNSTNGEDHIGALAGYAEMAASHDMIGFVTSTRGSFAAAWGGKSRVLSINPMAVAIPAGAYPPIILDMATTNTSMGHLYVKQLRGEPIPEGWILDKEGRPSTNPQDFFDGGALLPFGTYKGYGLSVIVEAIAGGLGAGCSHDTLSYGQLYAALDPSGFTPIQEFKNRIDAFIRHIKNSPTIDGVEEVFVPGEIENRAMKKRLEEGIPIDEAYWRDLIETAKQLGLDPEKIIL
jgi:LDH2 family malate/lactate/ureidoglycolate dehydrogenase